jgi:Family of unknown function (DUF6335)
MAKRATRRRARRSGSKKKSKATRGRSSAKRRASSAKRSATTRKRAAKRPPRAPAAKRPAKPRRPALPVSASGKVPRLDRERRTLQDQEPISIPPSSLNLDRHASAARTGRAELKEALQEHPGMSPAITGGDVDANWEQAYFTGDEAPGGDNPTPDQEVVEDIGRAVGIEYDDNEELKSTEKVERRDKHRWELDPASAEDYKDRK